MADEETDSKKRRLNETEESNSSTRTGIIWCGDDNLHRHPHRFHPERPERVTEVLRHLREKHLIDRCLVVPWPGFVDSSTSTAPQSSFVPPTITSSDDVLLASRLANIHSPHYLARYAPSRFARLAASPSNLLDESLAYDSVYLAAGSAPAALRAASASLALADALSLGSIANGIAVVRPPGHHASRCRARGFCLYNNVAAVARALVSERGERVLIVDWDVHFGDGTATAFAAEENPCYFSLHRHDAGSFYPGGSVPPDTSPADRLVSGSPSFVGIGPGLGRTVNVGWSGPGPGSPEYHAAFSAFLPLFSSSFRPTVVLVSAGFDAARGDPLGGCDIPPSCYGELTARLCDELPTARGRVLLFLEGGYNLDVLPPCVAACVGALLAAADRRGGGGAGSRDPEAGGGQGKPRTYGEAGGAGIMDNAAKDIRDTLDAQRPYWTGLGLGEGATRL